MTEKKRLDVAVFERGLSDSRERAKSAIMAGLVYVNNQKSDKPGTQVKESDIIEVRGEQLRYVSRGGLKLEKAVKVFSPPLENAVCIDVGSSTGGFTDCMLQNGAKKVYAIDVGYGDLAWKLRTDERVVSMERTNIRNVKPEDLPERADFCSIDVAFISLRLVLPPVRALLKDEGLLVGLIKPQFEAGREKIGKKGVVRDPAVHVDVVTEITGFLVENGFDLIGLDFSPIRGPEGNIEYLAYARKSEEPKSYINVDIVDLVKRSHDELEKKTHAQAVNDAAGNLG